MNMPQRAYSMERRSAMAEATKARIRLAAVELHAERLWDGFTLQEVARRAGVTVQTVLRVYGSKEALALLALEASALRDRRPSSPPGDVAAAIRALYQDYEEIGDRVIRCLAEEPRRPALASQVEAGRRAHRQWLATVFAPQLRARVGRARERLLHALIVATDVYAWKVLRRDLGLDRDVAEGVVGTMIAALLQEGPDGKVSLGVLGRRRQSDAEPGHRQRARKKGP